MSDTFKSAISSIESIDPTQFANDTERFLVKEAMRKLVVRLETPFERLYTLSYETPMVNACLRTCLDLGIWEKWAAKYEKWNEAEVSLSQICEFCYPKPEANLLRK
jgi:hypothetical protein